ncbi:hypothetical protein [Pedobacter hartonius]|uniref:Uncharacterized protein n=1 Tax=Pedobacter hartonius TaxID=425514 RepID=A0A1H4D1T3_9SPHI|nr:hypothetical protein [Pedobacter hartonius]SEA66743.1 hypothetical protein SAMN05443550_104295 [Pedobacter hartonius]
MFDAITAEHYGWINRAIPDAEIDTFVDRLAQNIANLPESVIETTKKILPPIRNAEGFQSENDGWASLVYNPETARIMKKAIQNGAQTVEGELKLEEILRALK